MKSLAVVASLLVTIVVGAVAVQAAEGRVRFDGVKFFDEIADRSTQ